MALMQPPPMRRKKHRRNSTRSLRNVPGPLTRQLSASSQGTAPGAATPAQTTPRVSRRRTSMHSSEGSGSDMDTASLASDDSGENRHHIIAFASLASDDSGEDCHRIMDTASLASDDSGGDCHRMIDSARAHAVLC